MRRRTIFHAAATASLALATPAMAGNSLIVLGKKVLVAKSNLALTPGREWNKLGSRPGTNGEIWTIDSDDLNKVTFYGGIASGKTLFREVDKRNRPLPKVSSAMLITDIPVLLEQSYRIALGTPLITIDNMEPTKFAGADGIRFTYTYIRQNEDLRRKGEGRAAMIKGKLYMATYEAPALYYYEKSLSDYHQLAESAGF